MLHVVEPVRDEATDYPPAHVLTRAAAAVELVFFALDNASPGLIVCVCQSRDNGDEVDDGDDEFAAAATRLVTTHPGFQLVAVVEPGASVPPQLRAHAAVCEWPELATIRARQPGHFDQLTRALVQLQCVRPWCTPADVEPPWLASKPAVLVSDLAAHAERYGINYDLAQAEATGIIFCGGSAPFDWVMLASTAFDSSSQPPPPPMPPPFAVPPLSLQQQPAFYPAPPLPTAPTVSPATSLLPALATTVGGETLEARQFRQLASDLRDWLVNKPLPREIVLSRSGLHPFLTSEPITRAYACNPPTAAHVRHAVELYGAAQQLKCSSSPARNNGATIVRLALSRRGLQEPTSPPPLGGQQPPERTPVHRRVGSDLSASDSDGNELFARDKRLVDDLFNWLCQRGRPEVSCADLMPFYSAYPAYRKGGGQGSGIKHAITRFGMNRLLWLERKSGGDARIVRLDVPRAAHAVTAEEDDIVHTDEDEHDPPETLFAGRPSKHYLTAAARLPLARRLHTAQKRVHVVVHDHEVVSGLPLPLKELPSAFRAMHGIEIDAPESLGFGSLRDFLSSAPRLCCCDLYDEEAVRCDPPPPEMAFVSDLRAHIAVFAADRPDGITFAQLKERVKLFGQERHTSVRFLRGGILGVINSVLVPSIVIQLEPNGLFYPARRPVLPPAPSPPVHIIAPFGWPSFSDETPNDLDSGDLDAVLLSGVLNEALGGLTTKDAIDYDYAHDWRQQQADDDSTVVTPENSTF